MHVASPNRRFAGSRPGSSARAEDLAALAEAFLSPSADPAPVPVEAALAVVPADAPRGVYVLVPAGIEPAERRRTALAVAGRLAPRGGAAAVFLFENGLADTHLLGEPACGRAGPQDSFGRAEAGRAVTELISRCDQVAIIPLDSPSAAARRLGPLAGRAVFIAAPDDESIIETYRELKSWRARGLDSEATLFCVGSDGADEAGRLHRRLSTAALRFLGCRLAIQGFMGGSDAAAALGRAEPRCVLSRAPAAEIWPRLVAAGRGEPLTLSETAAQAHEAAPLTATPMPAMTRVGQGVSAPPAVQEAAEPCAVFSPWQPEDRDILLAAIEAQGSALLAGGKLRQVFRVAVDEPGAPALAAVRSDGGLVAVLIADGRPVDTRAAARWLTIHQQLLVRAYPCAGIREGAEPSAVVFAPLEGCAADGIRRFLPVKLGGHRGIVLLP
jgi:hypothetical protein